MNKIGQLAYMPWWWLRAAVFGRRKPLQSVLFISDRCNLSCRHCSVYNHETPADKSTEQIREELEFCLDQGSRFVDFEGGEPFLWRDGGRTVNDLCLIAREMGFYSCTITTNAQLPFDGSVADSIWVSFDGVGEAHERIRGKGTFARLEKNIANCGCRNLSANMAINVMNADAVADAIEYVAASPYFRSISLNFHTPFPGTEHMALTDGKKREIIDLILDYKKRGYPIMNSVSGLKLMKTNQFKKYCWISNFITVDGKNHPDCGGSELGLCDQCGFCMAGEMHSVMTLRPDTILAGLKLRM